MHSKRQSVADIKTSFETRGKPATTAPSSSRAGDLANMPSVTKRIASQFQKAAAPSIDAVLDAAPPKVTEQIEALSAARPTTIPKKPSWIGPTPNRPATPSALRAMKTPVTITYGSPGLQPPVYICTSLSDPEWEPIEMEVSEDGQGAYKFTKTFTASEGEYQYKLRLGPGDWWVCDDTKPQVDDGLGNKNNLVVVKTENKPPVRVIEPPAKDMAHDRIDSVHNAPLMPHENHGHVEKPEVLKANDHHLSLPADQHHAAPIMGHEQLAPPVDDSEDDDDEPEGPPLLRHESIAPSSHEQSHSPLFRHESIAIDDKQDDHILDNISPLLGGRKGSNDSVPEEADPTDMSLEQFPTDHRAILDHIERAKQALPEDEVSDHPRSPSTSPREAAPAKPSPSLPSVQEDEEEKDDEDVPRVQITEPKDRPAAPITPPMTPTKEKQLGVDSVQNVVGGAIEKAKSISETVGKQASESNFSTIFVGIGFAIAVAITAVGIWYFNNSSAEVVDA
ncbi:hypothetical protein HII31_12305 [Pseudocercospora fuligena]|uniref:AMP-activated protein kinase glycogen-binding domain-containing protein n=1 Tax=Pseudocercospora fuligena TaxID=685502 RepID=A0A8H6VFM7_9PEZI|nr:hypothetical protein HII31_12305 [Pseudocercospora fuligena]